MFLSNQPTQPVLLTQRIVQMTINGFNHFQCSEFVRGEMSQAVDEHRVGQPQVPQDTTVKLTAGLRVKPLVQLPLTLLSTPSSPKSALAISKEEGKLFTQRSELLEPSEGESEGSLRGMIGNHIYTVQC